MKSTTLLLAGVAGIVWALPALSQQATIPSIPDDSVIRSMTDGVVPKVLQYMIDGGLKLTYLGDAGGIQGYLAESPTGKIQTFYLTPDGQHVVGGMLFREGGVNVTGVQITDMRNRYDAAKKRAEELASETSKIKPTDYMLPELTQGLTEIDPQSVRDGAAAIPDDDEYLSNRDGDDMKTQLEEVAYFTVGAPSAPVVYMVADPNCPFCHKTWTDIRPMVLSKEISVRIILIAGLEGSEPKAISLLSRDEPARAWFIGEGSTRGMPVASPPAAGSASFKTARRYLSRNMDFVERNDIKSTPHLFYFDDQERLFESRGMPKNLDVFMSNVR